jgi:hypothetical protein
METAGRVHILMVVSEHTIMDIGSFGVMTIREELVVAG